MKILWDERAWEEYLGDKKCLTPLNFHAKTTAISILQDRAIVFR